MYNEIVPTALPRLHTAIGTKSVLTDAITPIQRLGHPGPKRDLIPTAMFLIMLITGIIPEEKVLAVVASKILVAVVMLADLAAASHSVQDQL